MNGFELGVCKETAQVEDAQKKKKAKNKKEKEAHAAALAAAQEEAQAPPFGRCCHLSFFSSFLFYGSPATFLAKMFANFRSRAELWDSSFCKSLSAGPQAAGAAATEKAVSGTVSAASTTQAKAVINRTEPDALGHSRSQCPS